MRTPGMIAVAALLALLGLPMSLPVDAQTDPDILPLGGSGQAPLEGTRWRLTHYLRGELREAGPEVAAWITLRAGKLRGSGGCTRISGRYGAMGDAIHFERSGGRATDCAEQTVLVQRGLLDGLARAASFEVEPGESSTATHLSLRDARGDELLRFGLDDAGPLTGVEWRLERYSVDGAEVAAVASPSAVLTFSPKGRVDGVQRRSSGEAVGSTGCNGFVGSFARHASVLSLGALAVTDAPCSPELAAQEGAMRSVLDATSIAIGLPPDLLRLTSGDTGDWLEFRSADSLEDKTWLLRRVTGKPSPGQIVTLRLADGGLSGEGPCGPYSGRYATDGRFITFGSLDGASAVDCVLLERESELLSALRDTVLVDRTGRQLRLLDASGRTRIVLRAPPGP